jgi:putative sigma-54 modulation protein
MDIAVTFRRTEPIESLKNYAEEKVGKLNKYLDTHAEAHVVLGVEKFRHQADVTLDVNGTRIKAFEETGDMYSAIDQVMDKIEVQLKRHLSKIRDHRPEVDKMVEAEGESAVEQGSEEIVIVSERMDAKPMDPEEAAMQLSLSKKGFLVFRNAKTNEINVIYKRSDRNMGLIEPAV